MRAHAECCYRYLRTGDANSKVRQHETMGDCDMRDSITTSADQEHEQQSQSRIEYLYTPLQAPSSFRTLEIKPGHYESDIECSLHEGVPGDGTVYYALSYVWGPPIFSHEIYCDGGTISITRSLFTALRNYRRADRSVNMWADAICINQKDLVERSQQVLLMQEIYSKSIQVRIWLGESSEFCSVAFKYMSDVLDIFGFPPGPDTEDIENKADIGVMTVAAFKRVTEESLIGLEELFCNPWFRRAWTFQEFICGSNAEVSVGSLTLSLDVVSNWVIVSRHFGVPGAVFSPSTRFAMTQVDLASTSKTERGKLYEVAITTRVRLSTDPRDKIYSLMGIATDVNTLPFRPDYNVAVDDLFRDVTVHTITSYKSLDLLKACNAVDTGSHRPSWVVDWNHWQNLTGDINSRKHPFCAAKDQSARAHEISICDNKLSIDGLLVDETAVLAESGLRGYYEEEDAEGEEEDIFKAGTSENCRIYEEILRIITSCPSPTSEEVQSQALWRTLVGGRSGDGSRVLPEHKVDVRGYFNIIQLIMADWDNRTALPRADLADLNSVEQRFLYVASGRRFCMTKSGRMSWVPRNATVGDLVSILCGSAVPVLVRPKGDAFQVVGQCYIHGIMDGEALEAATEPMRRIDLV